MDQLVQSMHQRSSDIQLLQKPYTHNISHFLLKEKDRSQKQNWVLKILKSIKILTPQLKSDIFYKSQQMMAIYQNIQMKQNQNLEEHFTQKVINLYIDFFNLISDKLPQNNPIKALMRPNNAYIITDLIKCLIQLQRKKFRDAYIQNSNTEPLIKLNPKRAVIENFGNPDTTFAHLKQIEFLQKSKNKKLGQIHNPKQILKKSLKEKYISFIKIIDLKDLQSRLNSNFLQLKQKNQKNGYLIEKFRQKCLGKGNSKSTNYDLAGLYTKEQLNKIEEKLNKKIQTDKQVSTERNVQQDQNQQQYLRHNEIKQNTSYSFRQKALQQFQRLQNLHLYQKKSSKKSLTIQKWLPLSISKKLSKQNPWQICIINNKNKIKSSNIIEDPQISSVGLKQFLLLKLHQNFTLSNNHLQQEDVIDRFFDKKNFLDFGRKMEFQLIEGDKILLKRQLFFPVLKQNEQKQHFTQRSNNHNPEHTLRRISKSQTKFLPKFIKLHQNQKSALEQNNNCSSIQRHLTSQIPLQAISKSQQFRPINLKKNAVALKLRKNSMEQKLSEKIIQRKLQIQEQNIRYQNRIKLLFGSQNQKASLKVKSKKSKTSLMGISIPIEYEHFLQ